jgi:hypothetical protein
VLRAALTVRERPASATAIPAARGAADVILLHTQDRH